MPIFSSAATLNKSEADFKWLFSFADLSSELDTFLNKSLIATGVRTCCDTKYVFYGRRKR